MIPLPSRSPFTGGEIIVTRFYCPESDSSVEGQFTVANPFAQLSAEQLGFVELFVRSEGRISRMEGELGLSYPTIRSRLKEIIEALGHDVGHLHDNPPGDNAPGDNAPEDNALEDNMPEDDAVAVQGASQNDAEHESATTSLLEPAERQRIIAELDTGKISFEEAMNQLAEGRE